MGFSLVGYDGGPHYAWSEQFAWAELEKELGQATRGELFQFEQNIEESGVRLPAPTRDQLRAYGKYGQVMNSKLHLSLF